MDAYRVIRNPGNETKELDGRAERGNNEGQKKSYRGLHPRFCVLGCPRRLGEESSCSFPGWYCSSICLTGVWPRMGVPGEGMKEESYATLGWNQPPVKFKTGRRFRGWCFGSREGVFGFNRYA